MGGGAELCIINWYYREGGRVSLNEGTNAVVELNKLAYVIKVMPNPMSNRDSAYGLNGGGLTKTRTSLLLRRELMNGSLQIMQVDW